MNDASSDARKSTPLATSWTSPDRRSGVWLISSSRIPGTGSDVRIGGMKPGWTELALMPSGPYLTAVALVKMRTAPFDAW